MLKLLLTLAVAVLLLGLLTPRLRRVLRLGQLPGDVTWRWRGQEYYFPFTTTLLLSLLLSLIARVL
ncbi:MAG: hypothetical protein RIR00_1668 [Pseudomonadota bacterium]